MEYCSNHPAQSDLFIINRIDDGWKLNTKPKFNLNSSCSMFPIYISKLKSYRGSKSWQMWVLDVSIVVVIVTNISEEVSSKVWRPLEVTYLQLTKIRPPSVVHQLEPVAFGEVSQVGDEGGDEEDVPTESPLLFLEVLYSLCPANVFWS